MNQPSKRTQEHLERTRNEEKKSRAHLATVWIFITSIILGYSYIALFNFHPYPLSYALKASPILLLLVIMICHLSVNKRETTQVGLLFNQLGGKKRYLIIYTIAILASAMGDIFLDLDRSGYLKQALLSFLITQLLYIYLFYKLKGQRTKLISLIPLLIVLCGYLIYQFSFSAGTLFIPVVIYTLCLLIMACLGLMVHNRWINIGALLFLFADGMIGVNRFIVSFDYSTQIIVTTYITAQLSIGWGLLFSER